MKKSKIMKKSEKIAEINNRLQIVIASEKTKLAEAEVEYRKRVTSLMAQAQIKREEATDDPEEQRPKMSSRVIKVAAERVYQLRPYESVRLSVEVETPDLSLSDDHGIRGVYLECVLRLDNSFREIVNNYNSQTKNH